MNDTTYPHPNPPPQAGEGALSHGPSEPSSEPSGKRSPEHGADTLPRLRGRARVGASSSRDDMRGGLPIRNQARKLRATMTDAEQALWRQLRRNSLGWRFRRQFPIPPYIVDFACLEARLIVEADGGQHSDSEADEHRTAELQRQGWRVLRFWNNEVLQNRAGVLRTIAEGLGPWASAYPHPNPPPQAGEGVPDREHGANPLPRLRGRVRVGA